MLKIRTTNDKLLGPLQQVTGIVERRHTLPILSNVLITRGRRQGGLPRHRPGDPDHLHGAARRQRRRHGHRRRAQALRHPALPARRRRGLARGQGQPHDGEGGQEPLQPADAARPRTSPAWSRRRTLRKTLTLPQKTLKSALRLVQFAMAVQDIRYYLNGMLFSVDKARAARGGHRRPPPVLREPAARRRPWLAPGGDPAAQDGARAVKLLADGDDAGRRSPFGANQAHFAFGASSSSRRWSTASSPTTDRVIPTNHKNRVDARPRNARWQSLQRAAILSNEKFRGVRLVFEPRTRCRSSAPTTSRKRPRRTRGRLRRRPARHRLQHHVPARRARPTSIHRHVSVAMGDSNPARSCRCRSREDFKYVVMPMRI